MDHAHRHRDQQCRIGVLPYDVHSVRVADVEPAAGDLGEELVVVVDGELAVEDLAADVELGTVDEGDAVVVAEQGQTLALDGRERVASRSMIIVSRSASIFWWMSMRTRPWMSFSSKVSRRRMALPSTRKTLLPWSSSIQ